MYIHVLQGIGKEGVLHKEGTSSRDWKARFFKLQECQIVYFETDSASANAKPLGQIPAKRMQEAVPIGEKNGFQRFAINMHYDTSVVLGSHTKTVSVCVWGMVCVGVWVGCCMYACVCWNVCVCVYVCVCACVCVHVCV